MDPEPNQGAKAHAADVGASTSVAADPVAAPPSGAGAGSGATDKRRKAKAPAAKETAGLASNNVRRLRQAAMMSKAELARRAGVSPLTIDRVEAGCPCRMDTKRKILEALGLQPSAAKEVFPDEDLG